MNTVQKPSLSSLEKRLEAMENWKVQQEVITALAEQNKHYTDERFDRLEKRLDSIENLMGWIMKLIIGSIIGALMAYVLQGGLVIP